MSTQEKPLQEQIQDLSDEHAGKNITSENILSNTILDKDMFKSEKEIKRNVNDSNKTFPSKRSERRYKLKIYTKYFQMKRKMSEQERNILISENIADGLKRHSEFVQKNNKERLETLILKETSLKETMKNAGTSQEQIDKFIEKWYEKTIKENSPLMKM